MDARQQHQRGHVRPIDVVRDAAEEEASWVVGALDHDDGAGPVSTRKLNDCPRGLLVHEGLDVDAEPPALQLVGPTTEIAADLDDLAFVHLLGCLEYRHFAARRQAGSPHGIGEGGYGARWSRADLPARRRPDDRK